LQNISETISNIPVYIGVQELKNIAYFTLLPPFIKWSKEDSLDVEDLRLRFKNWVELIPAGPDNEDVGAISSRFFLPKGRSKTIQFHPNKVLELYLELPFDRYEEILTRLENMEDVCLVLLTYTFYYLKPDLDPNATSTNTEDEDILYYGNGRPR
jgi:hypothetical protein